MAITIDRVRAGTKRHAGMKALIDARASNLPQEEAVKAVAAALGETEKQASGFIKWAQSNCEHEKTPLGGEYTFTRKARDQAPADLDISESLEEATEATKSAAQVAAEAATVPGDDYDDELPATLVADLKDIVDDQPNA